MLGSETSKLIKACADRCRSCGCFKLPRMDVRRKFGEDVPIVVLRCSNCGLEGTGKNIYIAITDWNKVHRLQLKSGDK